MQKEKGSDVPVSVTRMPLFKFSGVGSAEPRRTHEASVKRERVKDFMTG